MKKILEMRQIEKSFGKVKVLKGVNLTAYRGEVLALMGENGAGKSTLMKILSGVYPYGSYSGELVINGQICQFNSTRDAVKAGVSIIHQELNLIPGLSVMENIFLGREPKTAPGLIDWQQMRQLTVELLERVGITLEPEELVGNLSIGQQQLIEIAKALSFSAEIIIMDEPTSALTDSEVEQLFNLIRLLKSQDKAIIYISHKMDEIDVIADRVEVLRDGESVGGGMKADLSRDKIISLMVGRDLTDLYPRRENKPGEVILEIESLTVPGVLETLSLQVRKGEVLGIAGLMGSGRTELALALFGIYGKRLTGEIRLNGKKLTIQNPRQALDNGIALVTEDRKVSGLVLGMSVGENLTLSCLEQLSNTLGIINQERERTVIKNYIQELRIKTADEDLAVANLSGGNQQKVVLAKMLATQPRILILDEPTRGVDVGAKAEIYQIINRLAANGVGIIMISSELPEIIGMSDRVAVMADGSLAGILEKEEVTQEKIMALATGGRRNEKESA